MSSIASLIRESLLPPLEARVLLSYALGVDRAWLAARPEHELGTETRTRAETLFDRRRSGVPVAYLVGEREFHGLALAVTTAVLIPRPETELLVDTVLELAPGGAGALDLGTGSGAVAIALALKDLSVSACDVSEAALDLARSNAVRHRAQVRFVRSDWFAAFAGQRFDVIAGNPPYVASGDPHLQELRHEPRAALEAGPTGLECIEAIAAAARGHLLPGGWLALEHGYDQGERCVSLFEGLGYRDVADLRDLAAHPRVVVGQFDPALVSR
jgi:release factor glutamine methyltransferase